LRGRRLFSDMSLGWFLALFTLASCAAMPLSLVSSSVWYLATEQVFRGGVKGSPSGTLYTVEICAPASYKDFKPGNLNVNGKCYRPGLRTKGIGKPLETFAKGDTILLFVSVFSDVLQKTPTVECRHALKKNSPGNLSWQIRGREEVLHINEFKKLEPLLHP